MRLLVLLVIAAGLPVAAQPVLLGSEGAAGSAPEEATLAPLVEAPTVYPTGLLWPVDRPLGTGAFLSNYVDDEPAQGTMIDYEGGRTHLYDGHRGTDIAISNFRLMDRGVAVLAAAPGTVQSTTYHFGDRNTTTPYPDGGNGLAILHDDGTRAFYWHVRRNSLVVEPGERVEAGQPLAYVASSGWTPIPHLHFELSGARDPWQGSHHTLPSLWDEQPAYVGDAPIWMMDADVYTLEAVGGTAAGLNTRRLKERVSAPAVYGADEAAIRAWTQIQANIGDVYRATLYDPSGTEVASETAFIGQKTRYGWYGHTFSMPTDAPHGTWRLAFTSGSRTLREVEFEVGTMTEYGPRIALPSSAPQQLVAGWSFRLGGIAQELELDVSSTSGPVTYHLVDAPSYASLDGTTLRLAAGADQPYRSRLFDVVATDEEGRTDTMRVQAVHPQRPFNPPSTDAEPAPGRDGLGLLVAPNPLRGAGTVSLHVMEPGPVRLVVLDALGREAAVLASGPRMAGIHAVPLDAEALGLSAGLYTVRAASREAVVMRRLVVVR